MRRFTAFFWLLGWACIVLAASPLGWWVWPLGGGILLLAVGGLKPLLIFVTYGFAFLSKKGSESR